MRAADLVTLASAHGIDWLRVAGGETNLKGIAGKRRKEWVDIEPGITGESRRKRLVEAPDSAKGKGTRVAKAAAYSQAELGIAAYGVSALAWSAAQHKIANDRTPETLHILHRGLMAHASKFANQENWEVMLPARIERDPKTGHRIPGRKRGTVYYREALCMLVLDEVTYKPAFNAAPKLYAIYMGVEQSTWDEVLEKRFHTLQLRYDVWYGAGLRIIQQRINRPLEQDERPAA